MHEPSPHNTDDDDDDDDDSNVDAYKYLGVLEGDEIKHTEMKRRIEKEYFRCVRKILQSKLNGGAMVQAINCRAVTEELKKTKEGDGGYDYDSTRPGIKN